MSEQRPRLPRRVTAGIVLVAIGLVLWALYKLAEGHEAHSYDGVAPPSSVTLQSGRTYWLAVRGGVATLERVGVDPAVLNCTAQYGSGQSAHLQTVDEQDGSNATNQIASFVAPVGGRATVSCADIPATTALYVDNATGDAAGWLLLLGVVTLGVGAPVLVSGVRTLRLMPRQPSAEPV